MCINFSDSDDTCRTALFSSLKKIVTGKTGSLGGWSPQRYA